MPDGRLCRCWQPEEDPAAAGPTFTPSTPDITTIPAVFLGTWDWTGGSCNSASDLRMEIGAHEIQFYESLGEVEAVRLSGVTLSLDLAMEGEGEKWQQTHNSRC